MIVVSRIFLLFALCQLIPRAQIPSETDLIPKDTSFTVFSAYEKEIENFPFIKIAHAKFTSELAVEYNVVYQTLENRKLHLDIFYPRDQMNFIPAVILVHGGGWRSGDKSQQVSMAVEIAKAGFVTVTVEYRLSQEAKYPAAIHDLKAAIRWLKANAEKYFVDSNIIAVLGCSSGGHLAAMLGVTNNNLKFEGSGEHLDHSSFVQAIIDIDGILDFTHPAESGKDSDPMKPSVGKLWLGYSYKENPNIWEEASPIRYADKNSSPFLFINSSIERFHAGRDSLINLLTAGKIYSEIHTYPDTPHTFWFFHPWFNSLNRIIVDFLNKIFLESIQF